MGKNKNPFAGKRVPTNNTKATKQPSTGKKKKQKQEGDGGDGSGGRRKKQRSFWGLVAAGAGFAGGPPYASAGSQFTWIAVPAIPACSGTAGVEQLQLMPLTAARPAADAHACPSTPPASAACSALGLDCDQPQPAGPARPGAAAGNAEAAAGRHRARRLPDGLQVRCQPGACWQCSPPCSAYPPAVCPHTCLFALAPAPHLLLLHDTFKVGLLLFLLRRHIGRSEIMETLQKGRINRRKSQPALRPCPKYTVDAAVGGQRKNVQVSSPPPDSLAPAGPRVPCGPCACAPAGAGSQPSPALQLLRLNLLKSCGPAGAGPAEPTSAAELPPPAMQPAWWQRHPALNTPRPSLHACLPAPAAGRVCRLPHRNPSHHGHRCGHQLALWALLTALPPTKQPPIHVGH